MPDPISRRTFHALGAGLVLGPAAAPVLGDDRPADGPVVDAETFVRIVKERTAPLKSLAFHYEGEMRWTGPRDLIKDPDEFAEQFQGAYVYRADGAVYNDFYQTRPLVNSSVGRHRTATLRGRLQKLSEDFEPKPGRPRNVMLDDRGTIENLDNMNSPHPLFMSWFWAYAGQHLARRYRFEGWEEVGGRNCLRVAIVRFGGDPAKEPSFRRYWVDVERNAQVLRMEYAGEGRVGHRIEGIVLMPFPLPDASKYWMPTRCRSLSFQFDARLFDKPVFERTYNAVIRSVHLNRELPDALFSLRRAQALPDELDRLTRVPEASELRRRYEAQDEPGR
jgi:hypothetical protein